MYQKILNKNFVIVMVCLIVTSCATRLSRPAIEKNDIYFTKVNIRYEKPYEIFSTNYHMGNLLKIGTKVKIIDFNHDEIEFENENTNARYIVVRVSKYTDIKIEELFGHYFSKENVLESGSGAFYNFTKDEQENIQKGTIAVGMSKDAVIMSYGYPPTHVTPSLKNDSWTYWENRFNKTVVNFKDNVISDIIN